MSQFLYVAAAGAVYYFGKKALDNINNAYAEIDELDISEGEKVALKGTVFMEWASNPLSPALSPGFFEEANQLLDEESDEYENFINQLEGLKNDSAEAPRETAKELNEIDPESGDPDEGTLDGDSESGDPDERTTDGDSEDTDTHADEVESKADDAEADGSPLILDMDGDGVELISLNSGDAVYWDIDVDGFAEASGWVSADDGLLAIDLNSDGKINNSSELFGDQTGFGNGFLALAAYDTNNDGLITSADANWDDLIVWQDINVNGISESAEQFSLDEKLITQIDLGYSDVSYAIAGNDIKQESTFTINGNTNDIVDAYFKYSNMNTVHDEAYIPDYDVYFVLGIDLRGYGNLPHLSISMSIDNDTEDADSLISLVSDLHDTSFTDLFDGTLDLQETVKDIMFRWAGVDAIDSTSRGPNVDARELEFIEKFIGRDFVQNAGNEDPMAWAGQDIKEAFHIAYENVFARLLTQSAGSELFEGDIAYNLAADSIEGITGLNTDRLDDLETAASALSTTAEKKIFWGDVVRMIEFSVGVDNLPGGDQTLLDASITASDATLDLSDILDAIEFSGHAGSFLSGDNAANVLTGGATNDDMNGLGGDDELYGNGGSDYLQGGGGNDTYYYDLGDGWDSIRENSTGSGNNDDRVIFGAGIDAGDLTLSRAGLNLVIDIDTGVDTGRIVAENQFHVVAGAGYIEFLEFDDSSTIDLLNMSFTTTGTAGNDTIRGLHGNTTSGEDTIYGGDGHDTLTAYAPNEQDYASNWLYGEAGNDTLNGGRGADELYGGTGDDTINADQGNDEIHAGVGNDYAAGGTGDDVYYYTSGLDTYVETSSGDDELHLDAAWNGYSPDYFRIGDDMSIEFDQDNKITIQNFFAHATYNKIETMVFEDTTSVDLTTVAFIEQGTSGNDSLPGTSGDDLIYGFDGNDTLGSGYGNGNDTLFGGSGDDILNGGRHDDYLDGGAGDDTLKGLGGDDHYFYVSGHDVVNESNGADILEIGSGWALEDLQIARYAADFGDLVITLGTSGSNSITINYHAASNYYVVETLRMNDGSGDIDLTAIDEYIAYGDETNNNIYGVANLNGRVNSDIIYGYGGNDYIDGDDGDDTIYGGDGNDTLRGDHGNDHLYGEAGDDVLYGWNGDDTFYYSEGHDTMYDTAGVETVVIDAAWSYNDLTFMRYDTAQNDLIITFAGSGADSITLKNHFYSNDIFEHLYFAGEDITVDLTSLDYITNGTTGNDTIYGVRNNSFNGYATNDTLYGLEGNDTLNGEEGNDILYGGAGDDVVRGDQGDDLFVYESGMDTFYEHSAGNDTIWITNSISIEDISFSNTGSYDTSIVISAGTDEILLDNQRYSGTQYHFENLRFDDGFETSLLSDYTNWDWGTAGADTIVGDGSDNMIVGNDGDDSISAADGDDDVHGGDGNDTIYGGTGNDILYGADGDDLLYGNNGDDVLRGGKGEDILYGYGDADTFLVLADDMDSDVDTISDFDTLEGDVIDVSDLLSLYDPLADTLADFVQITDDGTDSFLAVDVDGGADNFVQILEMSGVTGLTDEAALVTSGNLIV